METGSLQPWILAWGSVTLCKSHGEEGGSLQAPVCVCGDMELAMRWEEPSCCSVWAHKGLDTVKELGNFPPPCSRKKMLPDLAAFNMKIMSFMIWKNKTLAFTYLWGILKPQNHAAKPTTALSNPDCHRHACLFDPSSYKGHGVKMLEQ